MSNVYDFGFVDEVVAINFPGKAKPWFWYYPVQTPVYFSYVSPQAGGTGWRVGPFFGIIKILPIDSQPFVPVPPVGANSLEEAISKYQPSKDTWGRFDFNDDFFWKVIGRKKPAFPPSRKPDNPLYKKKRNGRAIDAAVKDWENKWNHTAQDFNGSVSEAGFRFPPNTYFALPLPVNPDANELLRTRGQWYAGPIPGGFQFGVKEGTAGQPAIFKQAYSFRIAVAQLDPKVWDMSVFPPRKFPRDLNAKRPKGQYGGYSNVSFPLSGPQIVGGG